MTSPKLFIPGPVDVSPAVFAAMQSPMIGHRSADFQQLYAATQPMLKRLFHTERPVFISTSSAWGVMEGALRNLVKKGVLNCCCGAFSDKWFDVAKRCGKFAEAYQVEWGQPLDPEAIRQHLSSGKFDAITVVHNETSTGVLNPLEQIAKVVAEFEDVALIVDTVSSFSALPVPMDEWGIDVMLAGVQKALALPPGIAVFAVSEKALAKAKDLPDRGYYFDFIEFENNAAKNMTPSTPCISLIYGLLQQLQTIEAEGLEARYQRHAETNAMVHRWVEKHGLEFFAPAGFRSKTLTCIANNRQIDIPTIAKTMREKHHIAIDGGYGKIKGTTFRLSNMGNETPATIQILLDALDDTLSTHA